MFQRTTGYYEQFRPEIIDLIEGCENKIILDIGCAAGVLGNILQKNFQCKVIGVEKEIAVCKKAAEKLFACLCSDVTGGTIFQHGVFDMVIFADVLEHLVDPWKCLQEWKDVLTCEGTIIVSLPNVRHYKVVVPLIMSGEFEYRKSGVLDETHLRFFTKKTAREMIEGCGFIVEREESHKAPWRRIHRVLHFLTLGLLHDFFVQQWIFVARPT